MGGEKMTLVAMLDVAMALDTRPFKPSDFAVLLPERDDAEFLPDGSLSNMGNGLAHVRLLPFKAEFYIVKHLLRRSFLEERHQYTLMIGDHGGELWEQGPTFSKPDELAEYLDRIASRHQTVRALMSLGVPPRRY